MTIPWKPFPVDKVITGVKILGIAMDSPYKTKLIYDVLFLCPCGKTGQMSHSKIVKRERLGRKFCLDCGRIYKNHPIKPTAPSNKLHLPLWPVPGEP